MALEKNTVTTILQLVSDLRGETSTNTDAVRIRAVSRAEQDYAGRRFFLEHLLRLSETTGDGTNNYPIGTATFPMRKKGLSELFVGGTTEAHRYQVVSYFQFQSLFNQNNSARIAYEWFDQTNDLWKVHINPAPETGEEIYYSYFFMPPTRTTTSDYVYCSNPMILVRLALAFIFEGEDEVQKGLLENRKAEQLIDEQIGTDNAPAYGQLLQMDSIENTPRNRGIGTY